MTYEDFVGTQQGRWTVLSLERKLRYGKKRAVFNCECSCGKMKEVDADSVRDGRSISCGCFRKEFMTKHGYSYTREAAIYYGVLERCYRTWRKDYQSYGARGITVSDDWRKGVEYFIADMGMMPTPTCTLERVDHNGNYCKENCIWLDDLGMQSFNTRRKKTNKSGRTGVRFADNKWHASIGYKYKTINLGYYLTFEEAVKAREEAELKYYGFIKE